ncbi:MAG: hypothetical protein QM770_03650 [Tepidisphaeraceae bacterium]
MPSRSVTTSIRRAGSGVALLLVLMITATAAVMAWSMLASTSVRSTINDNAYDGVEAQALADSGVQLAMHYLRNSDKSPVALSSGPYGDNYYPGQSNLQLWSDARGTVSITVTNIGPNNFTVVSRATVTGKQGTQTRTVEADVGLTRDANYTVQDALLMNSTLSLPSNITISGTALTRYATVAAPAVIVGQARGAVSLVAGVQAMSGAVTNANLSLPSPVSNDVLLMSELGNSPVGATSSAQRTYTWRGRQWVADVLPITVTGTRGPTATNPAGVYYADRNTTLSSATINGSVIIRTGKTLVVKGTTAINAAAGLPAVVTDTLDIQSSASSVVNFAVNGVVHVNTKVTNSLSTAAVGSVTINGALMLGATTGQVTSNFKVPTTVAYNATQATVPTLLGLGNVNGVRVLRWQEY